MPYRTIEVLALGPLHLRTWGLMVGLGIVAGTFLTARLARSRGLNADKVWTLAVVVAAFGVLGSRLLWALQPSIIADTLARPLSLIAVWEGGLTLIGGLLFAVPAGLLYARRAGLPLASTADVAATGAGLGIAIGRMGCLLTGLHPGAPTGLPWGIDYLGAVRHPIPLYESLLGLVLLVLGLALLRRRLTSGTTAFALAVGYLAGRGLLDMLRAPDVSGADPRLFAGLTLTQALALLLVPVLAGFLLARTPIRLPGRG